MDREFPQLRHLAARLGSGSEVLGYDTEISPDHDWGPRLQLFLTEKDHQEQADDVIEMLRRHLPPKIHGYSAHHIKMIETDIGSIDQFSHSTDLRSYSRLHKRLESLYK